MATSDLDIVAATLKTKMASCGVDGYQIKCNCTAETNLDKDLPMIAIQVGV